MKIIKNLWIHFLYLVTFLLIPIAMFIFEIRRAFSNFAYYSQTKREIKSQWVRYLKFIKLSK